jgi:hypothetical protein
MAKEAKKSKNEGKEGTNKAQIGASAKDLGFAFGVSDLADELGIEPASVRVQLRSKQVPKNGSVYGWKNDKEFQAVVKQLRSSKPKQDEGERPAKKSAEKAPAKNGSKPAAAKKAPREEREEA